MNYQKTYTKKDYHAAINFALNYPQDFDYRYKIQKDIYDCNVLDGGWYTVKLEGKFVRSALKYDGEKQWCGDTQPPS